MNYQPTVDNDLQKAIDDITKTTDTDPIFSDPVAAPEAATEPATFTETAFAAEQIAPAAPVAEMPAMPAMPDLAAMPPTPDMMPASPAMPAAPAMPPAPTAEPVAPFMANEGLDKNQVKEAALRELAPIADKLDIPASRKFEIYKNVIDNYNDTSVLESAYHAASKIEDERERAEALLYLVDSIDKM